MSAAWAGVILAGLSFVWTEYRFRKRRQGRSALGPAPGELRECLVELRTLFNEIIADGGEESPWFMHEDRKHVADHVRDQAQRRGDPELKKRALAAADSWNRAFASAPPEAALGLGDLYVGFGDPMPKPEATEEELDHDRRRGQVLDAANEGVGHCRAALKRLTELERATPEG